MVRVVIVPGLAVRSYAVPAAAALSGAGHAVELLPAPGWRGVPDRLREYGVWLAERLTREPNPVDVVVGLSVGTQAAAVTAARCAAEGRPVGRLLLISPTVQPDLRSRRQLITTWLRGDHHPDSPSLAEQAPDWARAGAARIYRCLASTLVLPLERVLADVEAPVTIVHTGWDNLTRYDYAASLAFRHAAELLELPAAPHSWPIGDESRFVELISTLVERDRRGAEPAR
jgi:pimeloyl-ACP methyl ester carboxylesterase